MRRLFSHTTLTKVTFLMGFGVLVALGSMFATGRLSPFVSARAMECNDNSIIYCGFDSKSTLIDFIHSGDGRGHKDLAAIYAQFGLPASEYSRFVSEAQPAHFYQDGRVVVSNKVVATDAYSYGRWQSWHTGANMVTKTIGGTTIYGNTLSRTLSSSAGMSGYVLFDKTGTPQFMIMDPCGNPVTGKPVRSSAVCNSLSFKQVDGKANTYAFTTSTGTNGYATLSKVVYSFSDGNTVTKSNGSDAVQHTFAKAGAYTAKATVYATTPWGIQISSTSSACQKSITIVQPYYQCVQLGGALLDKNSYKYQFVAEMKYGNGAQFVSADFDFGDGKTATGVTSADGKTVSVDHAYAKAGNYSAAAVLRFSVDGKTVTAPTCKAMVTPTAPPIPECKPGVPVGDIRCNPCQYDASIDANDERCVAPVTSLPNTGAGNVIALGSAALVGGFLWYRQVIFRRHKRAFMAADAGTSPLPLANNPLDETKPLDGTPLQPTRSTFRRRRQF